MYTNNQRGGCPKIVFHCHWGTPVVNVVFPSALPIAMLQNETRIGWTSTWSLPQCHPSSPRPPSSMQNGGFVDVRSFHWSHWSFHNIFPKFPKDFPMVTLRHLQRLVLYRGTLTSSERSQSWQKPAEKWKDPTGPWEMDVLHVDMYCIICIWYV